MVTYGRGTGHAENTQRRGFNSPRNLRAPWPFAVSSSLLLGGFPAMTMLLTMSVATLSATAQTSRLEQRLERAATLIRDNRMAEAEQQLTAVLKIAPNEAGALNLLGTIRAQQNRLPEAETLFARALRFDQQFVGAHMNLARLYLLKGAPEKAAAELRSVIRLDPKDREAGHQLARLLLSQSQVDECIDFVEKAKQVQQPSAALLIVLGDAYLTKGDANKAAESYLLALSEQTEDADALLGLARVSQSKADKRTALLYLFRAKELAGNSPDLLYKFALVALKSELYEEAKSALERAVKLRPTEAAYLLALGATWIKRPDLLAAEQAFRRALELQPDSAQAQMSLAYVLFKQKKYPDARAYLEKIIKANASTPEPFYYLGLIAQEQSEDERALEILERLVQRFPAFTNAHVALGSTYLKLKNYDRAQQELELAVRLNPDEPTAHYQLAMLYARLKDPKRAQEEMRIVEQLKNTGKAMEKENDVLPPAKPSPR